jgi:mRNA-degrading endonuclease RelE of RelBE toxin-antitoxin system
MLRQRRIIVGMVIIETSIFTKKIIALLSDEEYRSLQNDLIETPTLGDLIQGTGGIRKVRWGVSGRGKRSGIRVIYYWATRHDQIFMLHAYAKNELDDLTKDQLSALKEIVAMEFKDAK